MLYGQVSTCRYLPMGKVPLEIATAVTFRAAQLAMLVFTV